MVEDQQRGPSWADVQVHCEVFEREHLGEVWYEIRRRPARNGARAGLYVRICVSGCARESDKQKVLWRGYNWPHPDHKTMPGLLLRALHEIENECLNRWQRAEALAQTALPF
jgi:hypothetical protein